VNPVNYPMPPEATGGLLKLAAEPKSAEVTDWAARIGWVVGLVVFIALMYWLMRQGWKWRGTLQGGLPELPRTPEGQSAPLMRMSGRYHGSTSAGQWLDRIVAQGLGVRSRVELTLTAEGLDVVRPGAQDFFIPVRQLEAVRLDKGIAGKVLTEGGLLIVTWKHGDQRLDSGFRSDNASEHAAWVQALRELLPEQTGADKTTDHETNTETEGAR
jgi:hypothetical protein